MNPPASQQARTRHAVLLTSYGTGATRGKNLGTPGYSYDIVAQLFRPLLERWGEVVPVARDCAAIDAAAEDARRRDMEPVHVSFVPFQDVCLSTKAPNVIVPAWEFPDVPNEAFDGNPHNDWVATSALCDLVIVGGPYTVATFRNGGIRAPIYVVPVPTPQAYFDVPPREPGQSVLLGCGGYVFQHETTPAATTTDPPASAARSMRAFLRRRTRLAYRHGVKPLVPPAVHGALRTAAHALAPRLMDLFGRQHRRPYLELSGVVYTSIFNPADGRKNWEDLLGGFLTALGDCCDATLVLKLIARDPTWSERIADYYHRLDRRHRCRVAFITDYLSDQQMLELCRATTYYLSTTRAEGNCLPVMNYLAAGRPTVSTCHTALSDYFTDEVGFVIDSHPEPAIWPHDSRLRFKTSWARVVFPSLLDQLRRSYEVARNGRQTYEALAARGRDRIREWAHPEVVWTRLQAALDALQTLPPARVRAA
jgi:hypothetical protein